MSLLNPYREPAARKAAAAVLMLFALVETGRAETWNLEVATARVVAGQQVDGSVVSILLTDAGVDQFDGLIGEPKERQKEVRVDGRAISVARFDRKRRELRVFMRGLDNDEAQVLAERLNGKAARVEVVETAGK